MAPQHTDLHLSAVIHIISWQSCGYLAFRDPTRSAALGDYGTLQGAKKLWYLSKVNRLWMERSLK